MAYISVFPNNTKVSSTPAPVNNGAGYKSIFNSKSTQPIAPVKPVIIAPSKSNIVNKTLSDFLGGGTYKMDTTNPNALIKTPRADYGGVETKFGFERADIVPVSLGGINASSTNITLEKNLPEFDKASAKKAAGKPYNPQDLQYRTATDKYLDTQILPKYKSGEIGLREAQVMAISYLRNEKDGSNKKIKIGEAIDKVAGFFEKLIPIAKVVSQVAQTGLNPSSLITKGIEKVALKVIPPILQAPQRALTSIFLEPVAQIVGKKAEFTPQGKFQQALLGKDTIKGVFTSTQEAVDTVKNTLVKIGFNSGIAQGIALGVAPAFVGIIKGLDLTPIGGEKNVAKKIASSKSIDEIVNLIKPMFKDTSPEELKVIAEPLVGITDAKSVVEHLQEKASNALRGTIVDFQKSQMLEDQKLLKEKLPELPKIKEQKLLAEKTLPQKIKQGEGFTMEDTADTIKTKISKATQKYQKSLDVFSKNPTPESLNAVLKSKSDLKITSEAKPTVETTPKLEPIITETKPLIKENIIKEPPPPVIEHQTTPGTFIPKISKSIEAKAVEAKLTKGFSNLPEVEKMNIAREAKKSTDLLNSDLEKARAIIRGSEPLPKDIRATSLITAAEEHLKQYPDPEMAYELANSPLTKASSISAQELRLAAERNPESALSKILDVKRAKEKGIFNLNNKTARVKNSLKSEINKVNLPKEDLMIEKFLDSIKC